MNPINFKNLGISLVACVLVSFLVSTIMLLSGCSDMATILVTISIGFIVGSFWDRLLPELKVIDKGPHQ